LWGWGAAFSFFRSRLASGDVRLAEHAAGLLGGSEPVPSLHHYAWRIEAAATSFQTLAVVVIDNMRSRLCGVSSYTRDGMNPPAFVFDAYGTLFDVASVAEACAGLSCDPARLVAIWRAKQLEYCFLRALMGPAAYVDFWQVTADALDFAAEQLEVALSSAERRRALEGWLHLRPYPEVSAALEGFARAGRACIILSNGSPSMLHAAVSNAGLAERFQAVVSVDAVRSYKPDPRVYQLAVDAVGGSAAQILFISSNGWDAAGARAFGLRVAWVNRAQAPTERLGFPPDHVVPDISALTAFI
jgi:2-haloacid dehalogenase